MIWIAASAAEVPQQKAQAPCPADVIPVSKIFEPQRATPPSAKLPRSKTDSKGPAVLMPACKEQQGKKKDYPMA